MSVDYKIHILIPFYNAKEFLPECLDSILSQDYTNYICYLWDDGSIDNCKNICSKYIAQYPNKFRYYSNTINLGPAASKWYGLKIIEKNSYPNDIVLIIDGDDSLINPSALTIINNKYLTTKCWFTYGNCTGKWCDQGCDPPQEDFRNNLWRYTHPRSFKAGLIKYLEEKEFKINGSWLLKATDRAIIYNGLELAGYNKIQFINTNIYNYRAHPNNIYVKLDSNTIKKHTEYATKKTPKKQIEDTIHIVMCSWKRSHNIQNIVTSLDQQTVSKNICLHIINNNIHHKNHFLDLKYQNIKLNIAQRDNTNFAFERFLYVKKLITDIFLDYVIFIDDDQYFETDYIEKLYNLRCPQSMLAWFGKRFDKNNIEYWQNIKNNRNLEYYDYGGTGGCIIDVNIFNKQSLVWDLPKVNLPIKKMEDLWLSYILSLYNWQIRNSYLKPQMFTDKLTLKNALWTTLKEEKQDFLKYLILDKKWQLLND